MDILGSVLGGGLAGVSNIIGTQMQNSAAAAQASQQEGFQEMMSDTSYQRSVNDMKLAGINPMLAAGAGGASTPPGAMAPVQNPLSGVSSGMDTAIALQKQSKASDLVDSQTANLDTDTGNKNVEGHQKSLDLMQARKMYPMQLDVLASQVKQAKASGDWSQVNQALGALNTLTSSAANVSGIVQTLKNIAKPSATGADLRMGDFNKGK